MASKLDGKLEQEAAELLEEALAFNFRHFELVPGRPPLVLELAPESATVSRELTGGLVWRAGEVAVSLLAQRSPDLAGLRVLELGSGTGVAGLGAALCGADVLLTDLPDALPLLQRNVARNEAAIASAGGAANARALDWRAKPGAENVVARRDLVVAADLVWREDQCAPLVIWLAGYGAPCLFTLSRRSNHEAVCASLQRAWRLLGIAAEPLDVVGGGGGVGCDAWLLVLGANRSSDYLEAGSPLLRATLKRLVGN